MVPGVSASPPNPRNTIAQPVYIAGSDGKNEAPKAHILNEVTATRAKRRVGRMYFMDSK